MIVYFELYLIWEAQMKEWSKLQNGSDIRGVAMDGIPGEKVTLTETEATYIGKGFVQWLMDSKKLEAKDITVAFGRDSRCTGQTLLASAVKGVNEIGGHAIDCGIASTPSLFMSTMFEETKTTAGVMITASHLPFNRNGLKFFTKEGGLDKKDIKAILDNAMALYENDINADTIGTLRSYDLIGRYSAFLVEKIREGVNHSDNYNEPLKGLKIIVDAGNGAGGFFADKVLKPLGADTDGSQFLDPDGYFPNHIPNPEDAEAMASIQSATNAHKADLGIIFDTDVDRAAIVDGSGEIINRNRLIALMSAIVLETSPGATIVTDSVTSDGLSEFIASLGGVHHRFKRGYKNVINESVRLNNEGTVSPLAMETSGHGAMMDNYFLDDGAYTVTTILIAMSKLKAEGKTLFDLISTLSEPAEATEIRHKIALEDFKAYGEDIIAKFESFGKETEGFSIVPNSHEGVRINWSVEGFTGWVLLRMSLHDPVLPMNVEANEAGGLYKIMPVLDGFFKQFDQLN